MTELPVREARDKFAAVVDGAERGATTYLTRYGHPVAAVVPLSLARHPKDLPQDTTPRREPTAPGGRIGELPRANALDTGPELAWTRAALTAMAARLADITAAVGTMQAVTLEALQSVDAGELGTLEDRDVPRLVRAREAVEEAAYQVQELLFAIDDVDDALCGVCGSDLAIPMGSDDFQHWRAKASGFGKEAYTPQDGHAPQVTRRPRVRPAIVDGRAVKQDPDGS